MEQAGAAEEEARQAKDVKEVMAQACTQMEQEHKPTVAAPGISRGSTVTLPLFPSSSMGNLPRMSVPEANLSVASLSKLSVLPGASLPPLEDLILVKENFWGNNSLHLRLQQSSDW